MTKYRKSLSDKFILLKKDIVLNLIRRQSYYISKKIENQFYYDENDASPDVLYNWLKNHHEVKIKSKNIRFLKYVIIIFGIALVSSLIVLCYSLDKNFSIQGNTIKENINVWYIILKIKYLIFFHSF